ncbi:MAG: glycosyltransferase [Hyphomicrobiales bacterium]|nr:MAG: glycosyltransferase [Hyphomicrobiales bacterium]
MRTELALPPEPTFRVLRAPCAVMVTVVMACHNAARTLDAAISSVLTQTLGALELIVVDDGSSDNSASIVREQARRDARVLLVTQSNAGPSHARNRGVAQARGQLIAFIDADDQWLPTHLQDNVRALQADPKLGVSFSPCLIVDAGGVPTGERTQPRVQVQELRDILAGNPTATCSALVARRAVFASAGSFRVDMRHAEDQEWLFRVIHAGWRVRGTAHHTVLYRSSPTGLSADTASMHGGWRQFIALARQMRPTLPEVDLRRAEARMQLYFAQRALRTGQPGERVRRHAAAALRAVRVPPLNVALKAIALCLASLAPTHTHRVLASFWKARHG